MFGRKKKSRLAEKLEANKIWLNDRWFIDKHSYPVLLFDSKGMIQNGEPHPVGYCCKHAIGTDGFCNECWEKFIKRGLKSIGVKK